MDVIRGLNKMNKHFFKAVVLSISLVFASIATVEAARLGGGRSIGKAPSAPIQKQATKQQTESFLLLKIAEFTAV
jgi:hypothetical protein